MLTDSATSPALLDTTAVTPEVASPVLIVVSEPAGTHCTASVVPVSSPLIADLGGARDQRSRLWLGRRRAR